MQQQPIDSGGRLGGIPGPFRAPDQVPTAIDASPAPAKPAEEDLRNRISEEVLGKEHRFRFGSEGEVRIPLLVPDELQLTESAAARLAATRVYMLPGNPWPGVAEKGTAWLEPWARTFEQAGVGRVVPVRYTHGNDLVAILKMFSEPLTRQQRKAALSGIEADLARHPLKPGDRIFVVGHSYGARLGADVTTVLKERGLPVAGFVAIEDRVPGVGQIVKKAPAVGRVLEIENDPGKPFETKKGTSYRRLVMPKQSHMDMVLTPPRSLLNTLIDEFSR